MNSSENIVVKNITASYKQFFFCFLGFFLHNLPKSSVPQDTCTFPVFQIKSHSIFKSIYCGHFKLINTMTSSKFIDSLATNMTFISYTEQLLRKKKEKRRKILINKRSFYHHYFHATTTTKTSQILYFN